MTVDWTLVVLGLSKGVSLQLNHEGVWVTTCFLFFGIFYWLYINNMLYLVFLLFLEVSFQFTYFDHTHLFFTICGVSINVNFVLGFLRCCVTFIYFLCVTASFY